MNQFNWLALPLEKRNQIYGQWNGSYGVPSPNFNSYTICPICDTKMVDVTGGCNQRIVKMQCTECKHEELIAP